jgi:integrase
VDQIGGFADWNAIAPVPKDRDDSTSKRFVLDYAPKEARERMSRTRYQDSPLQIWGTKRPYYGIRVRVQQMTPDGRKWKQPILNCGYLGEVTEKQALRKRAELLAKVNNQALTMPAEILLREFVEEVYKKKHYPTISQSTQEKYDSHLKNHILPALGDYRLKDLRDVQEFFNTKMSLSWNTRMDIRNIISSIYTKAYDWEWWDGRNPAERVELGPKTNLRRKDIPEYDELKLLLANLPERESYPRDDMSLIIRTVTFTGLRISEVSGLKASSINLKNGWLVVRSRYRRGNESIPKTDGSERKEPLGDLLQEYRIKCANLKPDDYVFLRPDGEPYDDRGIQMYVIRPAAKAAGIYYTGFGIHRIRSLSITQVQQVGGSAIEAQIHAGHSNTKMTGKYTLLPAPRHEELVRRMQAKFMGEVEATKQ